MFIAFNYTDLGKQAKWKFIHGETKNLKVKERIEEKHGVRMSKLDELAGWYAPRSLPPEGMHLFFGGGMLLILHSQVALLMIQLGISQQIHREIMINGSMFTGSGKRRKHSVASPMDCLEQFLSSIVWPSSVGRFNAKVRTIKKINIDLFDFCDNRLLLAVGDQRRMNGIIL